MTDDFYEALSDIYSPSGLLERLGIDWETFRYFFEDYIEDHAEEFEDELPEYFFKEE